MKMIVGLGNPENKYAHNRHNVGFMLVDEMAKKHRFPEDKEKFFSRISKASINGEDVLLVKPQTYMNKSGQAVRAVADFYKLQPADILVIHDELDLPFGDVRSKIGGGHAGHNGLKSIDAHLGSKDYARLRLGIGHPGDKDQVSAYVLSDFSKEEAAKLAQLLPQWEELVLAYLASSMGEEKR